MKEKITLILKDVNSNEEKEEDYLDIDIDDEFEHVIINRDDSNKNNVFFLKRDSFFTTNIDSLYSVGVVRIDSIVTGLDTFAVISPDISRRVEFKAGRLKKMANQVTAEISTWDVQTIDNELIKNVLSEELENRDIPINFEYGILKDSVFTEHEAEISDSLKLLNTEYKVDLYPNDIIQKNLKLAVYVPERESFIYRSLNWLLIASFLFSVVILVTFGLSIFYLLRQKKISEMKSDFINNMIQEIPRPASLPAAKRAGPPGSV